MAQPQPRCFDRKHVRPRPERKPGARSESGEQQTFDLQRLPAELRNMVYKELLRAARPKIAWRGISELQQALNNDISPGKRNYFSPGVETAILRTSKQISAEAWDELVKENRFVRIDMINLPTNPALDKSQVPIISSRWHAVTRFKGYLMHLRFTGLETDAGRGTSFMILGDDLAAFLQACVGSVYARKPKRLDIIKCQRAEFYPTDVVNSLLEPISDHVHGMSQVDMTFPRRSSLAQRLFRNVKFLTHRGQLEAWIQSLDSKQQLAADLVEAGDHFQASQLLQKVATNLNITSKIESSLWATLSQDVRDSLKLKRAEAYYGLAQFYASLLDSRTGRQMTDTKLAYKYAFDASEMLRFNWDHASPLPRVSIDAQVLLVRLIRILAQFRGQFSYDPTRVRTLEKIRSVARHDYHHVIEDELQHWEALRD